MSNGVKIMFIGRLISSDRKHEKFAIGAHVLINAHNVVVISRCCFAAGTAKKCTKFYYARAEPVTTLRRPVSGEQQNFSGNMEILPGIGRLEKISGKHEIISGHCMKKAGQDTT